MWGCSRGPLGKIFRRNKASRVGREMSQKVKEPGEAGREERRKKWMRQTSSLQLGSRMCRCLEANMMDIKMTSKGTGYMYAWFLLIIGVELIFMWSLSLFFLFFPPFSCYSYDSNIFLPRKTISSINASQTAHCQNFFLRMLSLFETKTKCCFTDSKWLRFLFLSPTPH